MFLYSVRLVDDREAVRPCVAGGVGRPLRRLHPRLVQGEGSHRARGQRHRQGRPGDASGQPVDPEDTWETRAALWVSRGTAHGVRHKGRRQGPLASRPV